MADNKQLEILKKGVEAWNAWRSDNRGVEINLPRANLSRTNLPRANLSRANLSKANLIDANLTGANLRDADLRGADLRKARNITVKQLLKTKTLYHAIMDSTLKYEVMKIKPEFELFEEPSR